MRHLSTQIDNRLREVENWWKLQCFLRRTILLALGATLFVLALGMLIVTRWITQPVWANSWLIGLVIVSVVAWLIIALVSAGTPKDPDWLAAALEKSNLELEDRLNTLVYLQSRRDDQSQEISRALEHQVHRILRAAPSGCPFSWREILRSALTCLTALLVTVAFFKYFQPWERLQAAAAAQELKEEVADLEIPETPNPADEQPLDERQKVPWGEIRITEPGRDLKVTRLDLIPMQIEAASNRTLERAEWVTLISEGPTERHGLPAPEHPNYVVYRPSLIVEDYGLEEWDVMSYFAEAHTKEGEDYRSIEYFLEVVPPRPELEQLPEPAYQSLEDITGLIEWQEEVIRETGRLEQLRELDDEGRKRRHDELAAQEQQLQKSAQHLAARLESRFGTDPLEGLRERFDSAAYSLADAQKKLEKLEAADSTQDQRTALGRLVAARKHFHERVKQNPAAFDVTPEERVAQQNRDESRRPLDAEQLQELRQELDERKQALTDSQDKLQQLITRQQVVELKTKRARDGDWEELADDEQQLNQELQQLAKQSPEMSEDFQSKATDAGQTLQKAQEALSAENKPAAEQETAGATEQLEQLAETLNNEMEQVELAEQMLLEERLRRNREEYAEIEEQAEPRASEELEETTQETQEIVEELEKIAKQQPPAEPPEKTPSELQQELTPEKREQLTGQCDKMCQQPGAAGQSQTAGEIGQSLDKLSQALQKDIGQKLAGQGSPQHNQQLDQMQASQQQLKQARQAVQQALAEQTDIERSIKPRNRQPQPQLSRQQKQAADALEEAMQQNPQGFSQCQSQASGAKNAMRQSERALQSSNPLSRQRAKEASEELRRLDSALEEQQQQNQLADAYRQKQMLDEQIEQLKRFEQNPESVSPSQCQSSGGACKNLTGSMQQTMQQPGMSEAFGPKLQKALNDENKQQIDRQSDALADSKTPGEVKSASEQLRKSLEEISRAFESGQPNQGFARRPGNSLKPSGQQAIADGLRRLESESQRNRQGRPIPRQASQQLREDAVAHLAEGLFGEYGYNEQTRAVIAQWREELKDPDFTVDQRVVQQLLRDIQQARGEIELGAKNPDRKPGVQTIDPSKYPPEYRPLIESYFQKLSERP